LKLYEKALAALTTLSGYLSALFMAALSVIVFLGVFSRYVLNDPWQWTEEAARICFVWVVFLAASIGVRRGLHFRFTLLLDHIAPAWKRALEVLANVWVIFFAGIMVVRGYSFAILNLSQLTPTMQIPWAWVYISVPISGVLMVLYSVEHIRTAAMTTIEPLESPHPAQKQVQA
jgi:TRAP-type C4-dicarboxylate transport system permease small subunit